jgi:AbrB family looped-hinge helix DNA binding protein
MGSPDSHTKSFYGLATVGAKGQIVIPAKAREELCINTGDSLVVIGIKEHGMLGVCPVRAVEAMLATTVEHLDNLRQVIEKTKDTKGD